MRYFCIAMLAILVATVCMTGPLQAGQREGAFTVSPMVGYHVFDGDQDTDNNIAAGFSLGYNVTKHWSAELETRYTPTQTDESNDKDVDLWTVGMNALYHFNPDGPFVPYVSAGAGVMFFRPDGYENNEDYVMQAGVGAKYFVSDNTALRVDMRYLIDFHSDQDWADNGEDQVANNFLATAGLYWQFGGQTPPPPQPLDSDADGISDIRDKCPDTPFGVMVDAVGCPPVEKTPPPAPVFVDGDDDGDGVPNSRDKCPGTEKGVIVDEVGCPVKFTMQIEFDFDKAMVRPEYHEKLREAAEFIKEYPGTQFLLAGHTDSIGTEQYNKVLSKRRAAAVKKYLVEEFGIAAHLMSPRGYGETQPIASNDTEEGRQRNRRVDVICCTVIPPE